MAAISSYIRIRVSQCSHVLFSPAFLILFLFTFLLSNKGFSTKHPFTGGNPKDSTHRNAALHTPYKNKNIRRDTAYSTGYLPGDTMYAIHKTGDTTYYIRQVMDTGYARRLAEDTSDNIKLTENNYDEILITLTVPRIGSVEIPAVVYNKNAYLPIREVFDFLKIRNIPSSDLDSIYGFFINPKSPYLIDKTKNRIYYNGKTYRLKATDLIKTEDNLYLRSDFFGQVFGLDCKFDFRSLTITLTTKLELPAIREMELEQLRNNLGKLKGEKKADTTLKRDFTFFHLGMADWALSTNLDNRGVSNVRANLDLGVHLAGGEADVALAYNEGVPLTMKDQFYKWKYVDNDQSLVKQVTLGKLYAAASSSIFAPITGVQLTNTPTTYRRSFGTYRLSDKTEPGWTVELYVNDVLVNYLKADASGFFTFEVPLVYGNSTVRLRFYSPWGEETSKDENISIPFNFLPVNEFQYSLSAGVVSDDAKSKFSRLRMDYGLGSRITIGGGVEYLSSVTSGPVMPYVNASVRLGSTLLISGAHTQGVSTQGLISYRLPSNVQAELTYVKYTPGQTAIKYNYLSETRATFSMPIHTKKFAAFTRVTLDQVQLPKQSKYTSGEFLFSSMFAGISSNFTTYAILSDAGNPLVYSNLAVTYRLPLGLRVTPTAQYEYREKSFSMLKAEVEKNLFNHGFLNISYQKDILAHTYTVGVGLRYTFSFAQTSLYTTQSEHTITSTAAARGSLLYDDINNKVRVNSDNNVGKGGLIIMPYLDINGNGVRDATEPRVTALNIRINGGKIQRSKKDSIIRVTGLEAYNEYFIDLDKNNFDNVTWQIKNQTIKVSIEPNQFRLIEVPVVVMGEVGGTVYLDGNKGLNGIGRIIVGIYDKRGKLITRILSEADGYFNFMGLIPGSYTARLDADQLAKLHMGCETQSVSFEIKPSTEGDVVDGLKFTLK